MIKAETTSMTLIIAITVSIALLIAILLFLVPRIFSTSQTFKDTDQETSLLEVNKCTVLCNVVETSNIECTSDTEFCQTGCDSLVKCEVCEDSSGNTLC